MKKNRSALSSGATAKLDLLDITITEHIEQLTGRRDAEEAIQKLLRTTRMPRTWPEWQKIASRSVEELGHGIGNLVGNPFSKRAEPDAEELLRQIRALRHQVQQIRTSIDSTGATGES